MITALRTFFDRKRLIMPMIVALEEGLFTTFARAIFKTDD